MPLPPDPDAIRAKRDAAGLTLADAAILVHTNDRLWRYWEAGTHRMPPGLWELFCLKVSQLLEDRK
jgi:DNA-binding transcriptional regulator YiaG